MAAPAIEYGTDAALEKLLHSIDRPGDFCARGRLFAPMPRLEVDGVGVLSFPAPETQVQALIAAAKRAPYGKGLETRIDTSVRDCWQIGPARIRLAGGAWPETFAKILDAAASGLGCPSERLDAQFYKLLIYERGGFFSAHRDTEKAAGMIATLSISLPVAGDGGDLIVRHGGVELTADMHVEDPSELAFAAFFADCTHEVTPVVEGHRLSLVFNLCLRPGDRTTPREAPDYTEQIDGIAKRLVEWRRDEDASEKLVWLLDHEYSKAGLSFDTLKNADAAQAAALVAAAERADCEIHAAIVHVEEHGDAELYGDYVGWGWDEGDVEDMEIGELYDSRHWLDGWAAPNGARPQLGELELEPGELLPRGALDDARPDQQLLHEATGNEGVSLERAYRHAALVLWPRSMALAVVASAGGGIGGAVAWVAAEFDRVGGTAEPGRDASPMEFGRDGGPAELGHDAGAADTGRDAGAVALGRDAGTAEPDRCAGAAGARFRRFASELIDQWPSGRAGNRKESRDRMLDLLSAVGNPECVARFLHEVVLPRYRGESEALLPAMYVIGPKAARRFLLSLVDAQFTRRPGEILKLLRCLDEERGEFADSAGKDGAGKDSAGKDRGGNGPVRKNRAGMDSSRNVTAGQDDTEKGPAGTEPARKDRTENDPVWADMLREGVRSALLAVAGVAGAAAPGKTGAAASGAARTAGPEIAGLTGKTGPAASRRFKKSLASGPVRDIFLLAWRCGLANEAETAAAAIADQPQFATPDRALPAALREMHKEAGLADTAAFATLWRHAAGFLLERSATTPQEPGHWKIGADIDCNCNLCDGLRAFCEDPAAEIARFPLRKDLRGHLHWVIDRNKLDIDHETERRGRPYTLVCTKNRASHRRRLDEYSKDIEWMRRLIRAAPSGAQAAPCAPDLARLREAVAVAEQQ